MKDNRELLEQWRSTHCVALSPDLGPGMARYLCSLGTNHGGIHMAVAADGHVYDTWPQ